MNPTEQLPRIGQWARVQAPPPDDKFLRWAMQDVLGSTSARQWDGVHGRWFQITNVHREHHYWDNNGSRSMRILAAKWAVELSGTPRTGTGIFFPENIVAIADEPILCLPD